MIAIIIVLLIISIVAPALIPAIVLMVSDMIAGISIILFFGAADILCVLHTTGAAS